MNLDKLKELSIKDMESAIEIINEMLKLSQEELEELDNWTQKQPICNKLEDAISKMSMKRARYEAVKIVKENDNDVMSRVRNNASK